LDRASEEVVMNQGITAEGRRTGTRLAVVAVLSLLALHPLQAQAVPILPGAPPVPLSGTTVAARPELAGIVLEDVMRPFSISLLGGGHITGTLQDRVVRQDATGTLDFYYRIFNDASSTGFFPNIDTVIRRFFALEFTTDADWRIDGLGLIPPQTAARGGGGTAVGFTFAPTIAPGQDSRFFFVSTNATDYNQGGNVVISGGVDIGDITILSTFQPIVVPEPTTLILVGSSLAGLAGLAWRRHRRKPS
jgi:hypothetical protein